MLSSAVALTRSPSAVTGLCSPGVSTKTSCTSGRVSTPRTRVRVVCGLSDTMLTFWPHIALTNVDLPTFGRPTSVTNPLRMSQRRYRRSVAGRQPSAVVPGTVGSTEGTVDVVVVVSGGEVGEEAGVVVFAHQLLDHRRVRLRAGAVAAEHQHRCAGEGEQHLPDAGSVAQGQHDLAEGEPLVEWAQLLEHLEQRLRKVDGRHAAGLGDVGDELWSLRQDQPNAALPARAGDRRASPRSPAWALG